MGQDQSQRLGLSANAEVEAGGAMTLWQQQIRAAAEQAWLDPALALAVAEQESRFNPQARSPAGAIGLMQLMPGTAASLGVDPHVPEQNIAGGTRYLKEQLDRFGSQELALAAYNGGPARLASVGNDISRMPEQTRAYVPEVQARMSKYAQAPTDPFADLDAAYIGKFGAQQAPAAGPTTAPADPFSDLDAAYAVKFSQPQQAEPTGQPKVANPLSVGQTMYTAGLRSLPSYFGNALTAAGKFPVDMWTGAQQRFNEAAAQSPGSFFAPLRETARRRAQEIEAQTTADRDINQALLNKPGGALGYLAGMAPSLAATSMVPGANTLPGAAGLGTILGFLQPTAEGESAAKNALTSGMWNMAAQGLSNILGSYGREAGMAGSGEAVSPT